MSTLTIPESRVAMPTGWLARPVPPAAEARRTVHDVDLSVTTTPVVVGVSSPALLCGLESLVAASPGMHVAGGAHSMTELLACCASIRVGVALVDPFIERQSVRAFMDTLSAAAPRLSIVLITDEHQPHVLREAVRLGACGFLDRTADAAEIRAALAAAACGRRYIAPAIAAELAELLTLEELTGREMQVLALLSRGDCNKTIARTLAVSVGTVKTHVRSIMCKLDARSRTEAALKAIRLGLVGLAR